MWAVVPSLKQSWKWTWGSPKMSLVSKRLISSSTFVVGRVPRLAFDKAAILRIVVFFAFLMVVDCNLRALLNTKQF